MFSIDLNSDIGESFGSYKLGDDAGVMEAVTSANIACGFHAGDPLVMLKTVELCIKKGVAPGAHPGYPDLVGFGRRNMACSPEEVYADCLYQIGALYSLCNVKGIKLRHVKPHGAMYNQAAKDIALAMSIAKAVKDIDANLILMGLANSCFEKAAEEHGLIFAGEAFADRGYMPDGSLVPRGKPGDIIHDANLAAARIVRMVKEGVVQANDGSIIKFKPSSICFHGDTPKAVEMARVARKTLEEADICVKAMGL